MYSWLLVWLRRSGRQTGTEQSSANRSIYEYIRVNIPTLRDTSELRARDCTSQNAAQHISHIANWKRDFLSYLIAHFRVHRLTNAIVLRAVNPTKSTRHARPYVLLSSIVNLNVRVLADALGDVAISVSLLYSTQCPCGTVGASWMWALADARLAFGPQAEGECFGNERLHWSHVPSVESIQLHN